MFDSAETLGTDVLPHGSTAHVVELQVGNSTVVVEWDAPTAEFAAHEKVVDTILKSLVFTR